MVNKLKKINKIIIQIKDISPAMNSWDNFGVAEDDIEIIINLFVNETNVKNIKTHLDVYQLIYFIDRLLANFKKEQYDKIETCYFINLFINGMWHDNKFIFIDFEDFFQGVIKFNGFIESIKSLMDDLIVKVDDMGLHNNIKLKERQLRKPFLNSWTNTLQKVEEWKLTNEQFE